MEHPGFFDRAGPFSLAEIARVTGAELAPNAEGARMPRDGFLRETFVLPRKDARLKAQEWFDRWPKQAYWTEIESWFERPGDMIEFTIRRLPAAD